MAFQLKQHESIGHGLRRLAKRELEQARTELRRTSPPADEAIHEARRSVKKLRAILQIIEEAGGDVGSRSRKRLKSVNHTLSRLRDADAVVVTLEALRKRNPHLFSEHTFASVKRRLVNQKRAAEHAANDAGTWKDVDRQLQKLRRAAKRLRPHKKGFRALAADYRSSHRDGRDAMRCALKSQRATDFHEWRKQIKALWYALRLIEPADRKIRRDISALHRAETALGDAHNVVILCADLSRDASVCRGPLDLDRMRLAANRYQCALRTQAIRAARRIYQRTPKGYGRTLRRAWKAWRARPAPTRHAAKRTA